MIDAVLGKLCNFLSVGGGPIRSADCLFVLAGRQQRKVFGTDLWKRGFAPELILSVGRFEWRKFYNLGLPADGGLRQMVDQTLPVNRHFFVRLCGKDADCHPVIPGRFGTWREAQALATLVKHRKVGSILVVSDALHLRRVAFAMKRAFRSQSVQLWFAAVSGCSEPRPGKGDLPSRSAVLKELGKYVAYRIIFCAA